MVRKCLSRNNVREIHFYQGDSEISVGAMFDEIYSPLDSLISHNIARLMNQGSRRRDRISYATEIWQDRDAQNIYRRSNEEIEKVADSMSVNVHLETGGVVEAGVKPRTNYHPSVLKRPSIVYATHEGHPLIVREAREYALEGAVSKVARAMCGNKFDPKDYEKIGREKVGLPKKRSSIVLVPESPLVLALERIGLEKEGIPRITPRVKFIGAHDRNLWYLRDFLPSVRDTGTDFEEVETYLGTLHGLGLLDVLDLDNSEYSVEGRNVVNIDPDLFVFTRSDQTIEHRGLACAKDEFPQILPTAFDYDSLRENRRKSIDNVRRHLEGKTIFDYFPHSGEESYVLTVDDLVVDNFNGNSVGSVDLTVDELDEMPDEKSQ